jgi:hypothetical protein
MSEPIVIITIIVFFIFVPGMFFALNRGRLTKLPFLIYTGYAVFIAAPVFLKALLQGKFPTPLYFLIVAAVLLPTLTNELIHAVKGRRPVSRFVAYVVGISCLSIAPLFRDLVMFCLVIFGFISLVPFFIQQYRYTGLNTMLIESLAKEAAAAAGSGFKWSSKPVTVPKGAARQYWVAAPGLRAALKKDRSIVWMARSCHKRLGEPNLEAFAKAFIEKVLQHDRAGEKGVV